MSDDKFCVNCAFYKKPFFFSFSDGTCLNEKTKTTERIFISPLTGKRTFFKSEYQDVFYARLLKCQGNFFVLKEKK